MHSAVLFSKYFVSSDVYRWQRDLIYCHFAFSWLNKTVG